MGRKRVFGFGTAFIALAALQAVAFRTTLVASDTADAVTHTREVQSQIASILSAVQDAETGQRGYLITGEDSYLQPYHDAKKVLHERLTRARELTSDSPEQQRAIDRLEAPTITKMAELAETISLFDRQGFDASRSLVLTDRGKVAMDELRRAVADMNAEEERLLSVHRALATESRTHGVVAFVGLTIANLLALCLGFALVRRHLAARRAAERRTRHQALHDPLTGLPNRLLFRSRVNGCVRRNRRSAGDRRCYAVLFIDMDRFKVINDTLGHAAGDALLRSVSTRLRANVREALRRDGRRHDIVARMGGDEFTVLLEGLDNAERATMIAERLLASLSEPHAYRGHEMISTPSIGIAVGANGTGRGEDLIRDADAAMYAAKAAGKACWRMFDTRAVIGARNGQPDEGAEVTSSDLQVAA